MKRPIGRIHTTEILCATRVHYPERRRVSEGLANGLGWGSPRGVVGIAKYHGISHVHIISISRVTYGGMGLYIDLPLKQG